MRQRYAINSDLFNDFRVENIIDCTKNYNRHQLLQYLRGKFDTSYLLVAEQVELYEKLREKLPGWAESGCLVSRKSLEQCSSSALAGFKSGLVNGDVLVDLSAGLGSDDVAFSKRFDEVISVDSDEELNELVRYNFNRLLIKNIIRIDAAAEQFLESFTGKATVFYIDADRRPGTGKKIISLSESTPDVVQLMPELLGKASCVLLKLSPMIDLKMLHNTFSNISRIIVAGIGNEVKEVLVVLNNEAATCSIEAVEVDRDGQPVQQFSGSVNADSRSGLSTGDQYFYEPSNMLIKAGLTAAYAMHTGAKIVYKNSHYMLADQLIAGYFGRAFSVLHHMPFSKSGVMEYLKQAGIKKANVSARNFVTTVDEVRKTFKIADGGEEYLFFTRDAAGNKLFWHCRKA